MNIKGITRCSLVDGIGIRAVLWCCGCNHMCEGCHNHELQDKNTGNDFDKLGGLELIYKELDKPYIEGLTLSGGDPLFPDNRDECTMIAKNIKSKYPNKSIWLYTGYNYEDILDLEILKYIDVLVDGKFDKSLKDKRIAYRGSSNQRIIDVKKTLSKHDGTIVSYI